MSSEDSKELKACVCNDFTTSEMWKLQGFAPSGVPAAVAEANFHVPSAKAFLQSNDARKNMTDMQETAQWLSGEPFWTAVLGSLMGNSASHVDFIFFRTMFKHVGSSQAQPD